MKLYGINDEEFGEMGDSTGEVIVPFDFNTAVPLLEKKPKKTFSICTGSFNELMKILKTKITNADKKGDLLILMRVKEKKKDEKKVSDMGWKISKLLSKDSIVMWSAQEYDKYRFDFYFY
jgi:hypothetical protein